MAYFKNVILSFIISSGCITLFPQVLYSVFSYIITSISPFGGKKGLYQTPLLLFLETRIVCRTKKICVSSSVTMNKNPIMRTAGQKLDKTILLV